MEKIPQDLNEQLNKSIKKPVIDQMKDIKNNFTEDTISELTEVLQVKFYMPNETVID